MSPRQLAPIALLLALVGCGRQDVLQTVRWSPDGRRALVYGGDGLYLTGPTGTLSPLLVAGGGVVAWLPDAEHIVFARTRKVRTWQALADALDPAEARALARRAEVLWDGGAILKRDADTGPLEKDLEALLLYWKDHYPDALRGALGDDRWPEPGAEDEDDEYAVDLYALVVARVTDAALEIGPSLFESMDAIVEIVPAPGGTAVVFVTLQSGGDDLPGLWLARVDGSAAPTRVGSRVAGFPAWAPDGRTVAYIDAGETGTLVTRRMLDGSGRVAPEGGATRAWLSFDARTRLRYLPDGRLLFDTTAMMLPTTDASTREQIFVLDLQAKGQTTPLTPLLSRKNADELPAEIDAFEVSPDGAGILVGGGGDLLVVRVDDGRIMRVPRGEDTLGVPFAWRAPGEFSYVREGGGRTALLLRRGDDETELSCGWPDTVLDALTRW